MMRFILPDDAEDEGIRFFYKDVDKCLEDEAFYSEWLKKVAISEGRNIGLVQVIFLSDDALLEMNRTFLGHDYFTDIITFPLEDDPMEAELYISIDRVRDNALSLGVGPDDEMARVMVHGLLHLCGYGDKDPAEQLEMREKENQYLEQLKK